MTRREAELELDRQQQALLDEIVEDGAVVAGDITGVASALAREHPVLYLGGGVAAGAVAAATTRARGLRGLLRAAMTTMRLVSMGSGLPIWSRI